MTDGPTPDPRIDPYLEPGELRRLEDQLRTELAEETRSVRPPDRLEAILHQAREAGPVSTGTGHGPRRWLVPVAAAAAVALIAGAVWWAGQDQASRTASPATGSSVTTQPGPSPTSPSPSPTSPSATGTTVPGAASLPVYFVGSQGGDRATYGLYREFLPGTAAGTDAAARTRAALALAVTPPASSADGPYLQLWSGQQIGAVTVSPTLITVDLATAGDLAAAPSADLRRLAVQELVWTAQAALQKGNVPVRFTVEGGDAKLFGSIPTAGRTFTRPPADRVYEDLAAIWVTSPARDQVLPAARPVTVTGQAIVFEGTVAWELDRDGAKVRSGHATASTGAPQQGTYSIPLGVLPAGSYTIRVIEPSQADGQSVVAANLVAFTVR
ncbi:Gmad2 immunoglobulin-like domain-containing protein [Pedococcus sp. NPDC057267]|uniref:Gmad2 immunoglobulin-like domain-containing protein n=1 Tax=Pedococcus sp. NPDC057267 TaxID=3346077 RepID=UPI00362AF130